MAAPTNPPTVRSSSARGAPRRQKKPSPASALVLRPARLTQVLLVTAGLLLLAHIGANLLALRWDTTVTRVLLIEFGVDGENNVPTVFSTALLLCAALLLATVAARRRGTPPAARWSLLAALFLLLALDEAASMHEYLNKPFRELLGAAGPLYYAWVVPGALFTAALFAYYLPFLWRLPARTRTLFLLAGLLYVGGALGVELLGAQYYASYGIKDFPYALLTALEEALEMTGAIAFIYALLDYLRQLPGPLQLRIEGA